MTRRTCRDLGSLEEELSRVMQQTMAAPIQELNPGYSHSLAEW